MCRRSSIVIFVSISAALIFSAQSSGLAAQPMSLYWNELILPLDECVRRASAALTDAGFTNLQNKSPFIGASHGDYTALFFCGTHKGLITLVVAGPDSATNEAFVASISAKFPGKRR
jgi:hypothetical protein